MENIYVGTSMLVTLGPVVDEITDTAVTDGSGTYALKDIADTIIVSGALAHSTGGIYRAVMTPDIEPETIYYLEIDWSKDGSTIFIREPKFATYYTSARC